MNISKTLNALIESGLSQKDIANQLGIGQSTVSELRSKKLKSVRFEVGKRLEILAANLPDEKTA